MTDAATRPRGRGFPARLRRLVAVYWTSAAGRRGAALLLLAIGLELGAVYVNVRIADAQRRIGDAVEVKAMPAFLSAVGAFAAIVVVFVLVSAWRIYVRQWLEMRWREALTADYVARWIGPQAYCQAELHAGKVDNPDQRIAEDIRNFVASSLGLALSLLAAVATLVSFSGLLWNLSADWPLRIRGESVQIPGLMLWVAIAYSVFAMGLTHLVGRPLIAINVDRQRVEADFRYGLVRFRENVEAVALARGAGFEQAGALARFGRVMDNWWRLIAAQRRLGVFTTAIGQANAMLPVLIAAPAYFAGWMSLGSVAQTRAAYGQVSGALSWFVYAYQEIAQWRASVERLSVFAEVADEARADVERGGGVRVESVPGNTLRLHDLRLTLPDGRVLLEPLTASVEGGDRILVVGSAGAGKTTLFRALAGIWPFGSGRIEFPAGASSLFLPQRPYLPIGTLRDAVSYPSPAGAFADAKVEEALALLGLSRLQGQLGETAPWEQHLSADEQQRLSIARVLLHEPDWVFLDDATAALDEDMEARVYELLAQRLPRATIVTMSRRPSLVRHHSRQVTLVTDAEGVSRMQAG